MASRAHLVHQGTCRSDSRLPSASVSRVCPFALVACFFSGVSRRHYENVGGQRAATLQVVLLGYLLTYLTKGIKLTLRYLPHDVHHFGWVHKDDIFTEEQRLLILANFGSTNIKRIRLLRDYPASLGVPSEFRLYEGIGHQIIIPMLYNALDLLTRCTNLLSRRQAGKSSAAPEALLRLRDRRRIH